MAKKVLSGKDNTNGFQKNPQNINRKGRPLSFKKQFEEYLQSDGTIKIKKENVKSINEDGSVTIKIPKKEMLVMKAVNWAMSNKGTESVKMIQWIIEKFDGKAVQKTENTTTITNEIDINKIKEAL